jgi:hypothetical protein
MTARSKKNRDKKIEAEHNAQSAGALQQTLREQRWEITRDNLLDGLRLLIGVAERRSDEKSVKSLQTIMEGLTLLEERIVRNQLPEQYVRIVLNDARLDSLIVYSQMKVAILYRHQELIAPTEKLRKEVQAQHQELDNDWSEILPTEESEPGRALALLDEDLRTLHQAEQLIREGGVPVREASLNNDETKSSSH